MNILPILEKDKLTPLKSFRLKKVLNKKVWRGESIDQSIREELLKIANDFVKEIGLDDSYIKDIILTGSLVNYNYSQYSDFDLHIVMNFEDIGDKELIKKLLDGERKIWNTEHNIKIRGYEVELYCQDEHEPHVSTGQFSLLNDKWLVKPSTTDFTPDEEAIKQKTVTITDAIDDLEIEFKNGKSYDEVSSKFEKIWKKIRDGRKAGLEAEGELSIENLVFKMLRRNGYIQKMLDIHRKAYDKQFK